MSNIPNFLEEENYDEPTTQPVLNATAPSPNFGEAGFGKDKKNPRKGTPRARITDLDIPILYFLGHFVGADVEACSLLNTAKATKFGQTQVGGGLTSVATTQNRLDKLRKLGVVERYRHPVSGTYSYGLTAAGFGAAREYGFNMDHGRTLNRISISRLAHYRAIALVAAKFASPAGYFKHVGISPVPLDRLISENAMRAAYEPVNALLKGHKKVGKSSDFGKWRADKLNEVLAEVKEQQLPASELVASYPVLLTLGQPEGAGVKAKPVHQPDLAVNLDADRDKWSKNLLIEVELSLKDRIEYGRILATLNEELKKPHVYRRAIYFTIGSQVETILKQIDAAEGYGLFEKRMLVVLPLTHRNGEPLAQKRRIIVGDN